MTKFNSTNHVLVVGSGAAGIAAAIATAELGTQVILVERYGFVGGLASSAMVGTICGLYYRHPTAATYAVQGFARQFTEALQDKMQIQPTIFAKGLHFLPYQVSALQQQATESLQQAGVKLMLHCSVTGVSTSNSKINKVSLQCQNKVIEIQPSAVIDCSGNAQISTLAGIETLTEPHYQAAAFVFQVSGLPDMEPRVLGLNFIRWLSKGIQAGDLDPNYKNLSIVPGSVNNGVGLLKLGLPSLFNDTPDYLTQAELEARAQSVKLVNYLQQSEKILSNLSLLNMAPQIGIRSSARCKGIERLEQNQVLNCIKPENGVAIGAWPIEYWGNQPKPDMQYFPENDCYWIPAGALVSDSLNNLFFAGRHLSATERAAASARVIGTCLNTGYAAGMLATEFVQQGSWQTAINKIQLKQIFAAEV
ncbi:MAG: FAD-dependent oxidoreductase [Methylococcales symbiont of Hymedesmia sp. n. MRB-2018]|nr:MAG: FAD-dependent oxidoreductase [Methylococcales symbiont of Hymedesmia sp. n. MRB-2018]KAF3984225.1 MAG: FAD-dependent oxidoreductase [Methylococcales symbiont of Hymedesmia sp. n. MRB-2018]